MENKYCSFCALESKVFSWKIINQKIIKNVQKSYHFLTKNLIKKLNLNKMFFEKYFYFFNFFPLFFSLLCLLKNL